MWLTVREAKSKGLIRSSYFKWLPDVCGPEHGRDRGCGHDLIVTDNLSTIKCSNPRCNKKLAGRAAEMYARLGISGAGYSYCKKFIDRNNVDTHLYMLSTDISMHMVTGESEKAYDVVEAIERARSLWYTYPEAVSKIALPKLNTTAFTVFSQCPSLDIFKRAFEVTGYTMNDYLICQRGIKDEKARQVIETIETFDLELSAVNSFFKIKIEPKEIVTVAITGSMSACGLAFSRSDFVRYANHMGKGVVGVNVGKALASCKYVVADEPSSSEKYLAGLSRGNIINSKDFIDYISRRVTELSEVGNENT